MKKKGKIQELESLPFEKALEQLEAVVSKMESGKLSLDEMMKSFEEGSALSAVCAKKLKALEKKIEILVKEDSKGGQWKDFDSDSSDNHNMGGTEDEKDSSPENSPDSNSLF